MTPEQKVVSLETAKKLKEAGFPQDTERYWIDVNPIGWQLESAFTFGNAKQERCFAAPDAQELLDWIHEQIRTCGNHIEFSVDWYVDGWEVNVRNSGSGEREKFVNKNLSEAITQAALYTIMRYKKLS